jgi:hypothetical protein
MVLEEPEHEVRRERAHREPAAGAERPGHAGEDVAVVGAAEEAEGALAEADRSVELGVEGQAPGIEALEGGEGIDAGGELDEVVADVDAVHGDPPPGELVGVPAGTAPDVEHPHPRFEAQDVDQEPDLLGGALREGVAQVRRSGVGGDALEPVPVGHVRRFPTRPTAPTVTGTAQAASQPYTATDTTRLVRSTGARPYVRCCLVS